MQEQNNSDAHKLQSPIKGMSTQTFVKGYHGQAQMNTNTISGMKLSSRGNEIMQDIRRVFVKK